MKRSIIAVLPLIMLTISLTRLSAQTTCQTTNIAVNQPVVSSYPYLAGNAVDGNLTTMWQPSVNGDEWIYVDLGQSYNLCNTVLKWGPWNSYNNFYVQVSSDTTHWVTVDTVSNNYGVLMPDQSYTYHLIDLSAKNVTARYIRYYFINPVEYNMHLLEIEVYNQVPVNLPVASLTAPLDGANYLEGDSVVFQATASEISGTISQVQFYQGSTLIGTSSAAPYNFTWKSVPEGEYVVTAKAVDASGRSSASNAINVFVDYPSPGWSLTGNKGTNGDSDFVGTLDSTKLVLRTNKLKRMTILPNGNIGIGVDSPTAQLHTSGTVRFNNYKNDTALSSVLTTDTAGNILKKAFSSFGGAGHWILSGTTTYDSLDNIGIGVSNTQGYKLAVNGSAIFTKVKVKPQSNWPDYVFKREYKLPDLSELEKFIHQHKHLPGIISANEVSKGDGVDIGENQAGLLKKIEELTLYLIDENRKLKDQNNQLQAQNAQLQSQQQQIDELKKMIQAKNQ